MVNILARNHVQIKGNGDKVILFAHGFGCDQQMWYAIEPYFMDDYKLVLFDYVGSGKSDMSHYDVEKYDSLTGYALDIKDIILTLDLQNIIFVGHSISSMIGMLAAIDMPERFEKLVMIGPSPCYINDEDYVGGFDREDIEELLQMMEMNFVGWANYLAPIVMEETNPAHTEDLKHTFIAGNPKVSRQFAEVTFFSDYRHILHKLQTPTLLIQCAEDSIVPLSVGQYLHENIAKSELIVLDAKGHYPHISRPQETVHAMMPFMTSSTLAK